MQSLRVEVLSEKGTLLSFRESCLKVANDNSVRLSQELSVCGTIPFNERAMEIICRCLNHGDISTFVFRVNSDYIGTVMVRVTKSSSIFTDYIRRYSQDCPAEIPATITESLFRRDIDFSDHPCKQSVIVPEAKTWEELFRTSNFSAFAYRLESSLFVTIQHKSDGTIFPEFLFGEEKPPTAMVAGEAERLGWISRLKAFRTGVQLRTRDLVAQLLAHYPG
ncbi:MAG: hypothetical protein Q8K75_12795 [Chlamydiales bacterium]|nr:hypothetical protein [Chlamydiales bacterium]